MSRATLALLLLCASSTLVLAACGSSGGSATPSAVRTTGTADVDTVIQALTSRDIAKVLPLLQFYSTPCTTQLGAGGPPKCAAGQTEGTDISVFPFSVCGPEYLTEGGPTTLPFTPVMAQGASVYAVIRQQSIPPSATQRPQGSYGIVVTFPNPANSPQGASLVSESGGRIVSIQSICDGGAKDLLAKVANPDFLLAPPK